MGTRKQVHKLINKERKKRHLPHIYWNNKSAELATSQAKYCARVDRLVHSNRYAFQNGENLAQGDKHFSPRAIVACWMHSKAGHREYLLSPRVKQAGVGIAKSKGKTYVAWAFIDKPKTRTVKIPKLKFPRFGGRKMLRLPIKLALVAASITSMILGGHGVWVYFSRLELLFGGEANKLFLSLPVPIRIQPLIEWMSLKGLQSWFIPIGFIVLGLILWGWQSNIRASGLRLPRWLW